MQAKLNELKTRLMEVEDLNAVIELLYWDQSTYMPPGGAVARGRQLSILGRLAQERRVDPAIGRLLDELRPYEEGLPADSDDASLLRVARRDYEKAIRVPPEFVAEFLDHASASYQAWSTARPADDFAAIRPYLEKTLELSRRQARFFDRLPEGHIADPLIDYADHGMTVATIRPLFAALRRELVSLVEAIAGQPVPDDSFLYRSYPEQAQWDFGMDVIGRYGYDLERGRQDRTLHPFTTKFSLGDVRITTNMARNDLLEPLFSTLHEAGHALYEQGIRKDFEGAPLGHGTSSGVHESQSRLWENLVGRSRPFWGFFYPRLQASFPEQLGDVSLEAFYRAVNKVTPSLIRVNADEVTYNLHVIIRFELEVEMLEGSLAVQDLPEAWHSRYQEYLGVRAPDDRDGVMQDVHWYAGRIGGSFQGYTLGNIISGMVWEQALAAHPEIIDEMSRGQFATLHGWLKEQIYQHGSKFTTAELLERVCGGPLTIDPYMRYLLGKYGELYNL